MWNIKKKSHLAINLKSKCTCTCRIVEFTMKVVVYLIKIIFVVFNHNDQYIFFILWCIQQNFVSLTKGWVLEPDSNILIFEDVLVKDKDVDLTIVKFKEETSNKIYPKTRDTLKDFLLKKCSSNQEEMLCPRCSSLFYKDATKSLESSKIKIEIEKQRDKEEMKRVKHKPML